MLKTIFVGLFVVALITAIAAIGFLYQLMPVNYGEYHIDLGLQGKSQVFFHENGVARILADNRKIATYTHGFITARDRRWQMEYLKRLIQGRFSEVFGEATFHIDQNMRLFEIKKICEDMLEKVSPETKEYLDLYTQGVNDYTKNHTLPLQFYAFGIKHEDWTIVDSCSVMHLMHFLLSGDWGAEIARDYISAMTKDENFVKEILSYHMKYNDNATIPIINDDELKEIGFF